MAQAAAVALLLRPALESVLVAIWKLKLMKGSVPIVLTVTAVVQKNVELSHNCKSTKLHVAFPSYTPNTIDVLATPLSFLILLHYCSQLLKYKQQFHSLYV